MNEIVCPDFYVDEWRKLGRPGSKDDGEFYFAADDGLCRLMKSERDEFGGTVLICRCGIKFKPADGQHVEIRK
jgi:hypothetical protein